MRLPHLKQRDRIILSQDIQEVNDPVWIAGFEPATSPVRGERPTKLAYIQSSIH